MATRKTIDQCLLMIKIDYSIEETDALFKMRGNLIFDLVRDITDEQFKAATNNIINSGVALYGKFPTVGMFREFIFGKKLTIEEIAQKEVSLIMTAISSHYGELMSSNPITLKTVEDMGGLTSLKWEVALDNDKRKETKWVRKEAVELWIVNSKSDAIESLSIESDKTAPMIDSLTNKFNLKG